MTTTGNTTSYAFGQYRLSTYGSGLGMLPTRTVLDRPPTNEDDHRSQITGSTGISDLAFQVSDPAILPNMISVLNAKTALPMAAWQRGAAGNLSWIIEDCQAATSGLPAEVDVYTVNDMTLTAGANSLYRGGAGLLFEHTIAHPSGVSATVNGTAVQLGPLSNLQSMKVFYGNLESPTPTTTNAVGKLQNSADEAFTSPVDAVIFTAVTATASYQVATIAGAVTNTWWRFSVSSIADGVFYPVCLALPYTT